MVKKEKDAVDQFLVHKNKSRFAKELGYESQGSGSSKMIDLLLEVLSK